MPSKHTLLHLIWLQLTGGRQGCPRWRFFLSLAGTYTLSALAAPLQLELSYALPSEQALRFSLACRELLLLPLPAASLPGSMMADARLDAMASNVPPSTGAADALSLLLLTLALALLTALALGLAWRRLRDAGKSPWHLVAGAVPALALLMSIITPDLLPWACNLTYWLGMMVGTFWLFFLYCHPTGPAEASACS